MSRCALQPAARLNQSEKEEKKKEKRHHQTSSKRNYQRFSLSPRLFIVYGFSVHSKADDGRAQRRTTMWVNGKRRKPSSPFPSFIRSRCSGDVAQRRPGARNKRSRTITFARRCSFRQTSCSLLQNFNHPRMLGRRKAHNRWGTRRLSPHGPLSLSLLLSFLNLTDLSFLAAFLFVSFPLLSVCVFA